jgi:hypothetical protein
MQSWRQVCSLGGNAGNIEGWSLWFRGISGHATSWENKDRVMVRHGRMAGAPGGCQSVREWWRFLSSGCETVSTIKPLFCSDLSGQALKHLGRRERHRCQVPKWGA